MEEDYSDDELHDSQHSALLKSTSVAYGKKFQRIKPPSRNEPSLEISEFHLLNKRKREEGLVKDLASSLDKTGKHALVSQKVKKVQKLIKPLPAPLEKPEAEKIKRTVAYGTTKKLLNRWEPVVSANRVADQLTFPLNVPFFNLTSTKTFLSNSLGKTPLEKEVENILSNLKDENKEEKKHEEPKKTFFLNRKEIMQQRRELARIRAQQSYRESKARQQNKIKSKRYHRILRRERTKKQIKEFEELMKVDPEAALKKLEELENTRAEERLTLRHRSTGQWARNRAVHAKYDKQSREMLAQQLRIGRELTQKVRHSDSSDGEDGEVENIVLNNDESNPWMQKKEEYDKFVVGYRKFWEDQKKNEPEKGSPLSEIKGIPDPNFGKESETPKESVNGINGDDSVEGSTCGGGSVTKFGFVISDVPEKDSLSRSSPSVKRLSSEWKCTPVQESKRHGEKGGAKQGNKKSKRKIVDVSEKPLAKDLDDIFEEVEIALKNKAEEKMLSLKSEVVIEPDMEKGSENSVRTKGKKSDPSVAVERKRSQNIIDESARDLASSAEEKSDGTIRPGADLFSKVTAASKAKSSVEIDPKKFISIDVNKPLNTGVPDIIEAGDDDNEDESAMVDNRITIAAAFTDDDVVTEFQQEKEAIVEENKPKDVDLFLPGWGSWAGKGVPDVPSRKKRRFILKVQQHIPRKDDKKDSVIINEKADEKARLHQVNELPFPYVGVETFEASIRAPIGTTWIPEIAHEKLTAPKVKTLLGAVIEPLTEDALLDESEMKKMEEEEEFIPEEL
ncbi:U3 small nucleolar RNA-associated protein 14 homolog A [Ischnura elegans]|uniref:U3 small nucleolar RNA-associated protein 14 homolog A n=1 Tax=Ischnura elegans TaxID=197161 RepID=UPI001ED88A5D|nr:U3 small nucleolar RNA-associated protein 14 homolog A [Ischnura elegans]